MKFQSEEGTLRFGHTFGSEKVSDERERGETGWLLETLQKPARWDHPTVPPNAQPAAVATDRSEGGIVVLPD